MKYIPLCGALGKSRKKCEAHLLSVSVRSNEQDKTIHNLYWSLWGPYKARVQNGVPGSYMDAIFKLVVHEESEIWTSLSHSFTKGGLLQLSS